MVSRRHISNQRGVTLVELLVVMVIMGIVSTLILTTWFSLGRAYSYTSKSSKAREYARDSVARMTREIRDASLGPLGAPMFVPGECGPDKITLYSFFNDPGADTIGATPRLVQFYLDDATMYRLVDTDDNHKLEQGIDRLDELTTNVVNRVGGNSQDVFSYTVVASDASRIAVSTPPTDTSTIVSIDIKLLIDLNPGKSPVFMDLTTSVQPRNLREF